MKRLKDKSTVSKTEYIVDHFLIGGIIGFKFVCTLLPFWGYGSYVDGTLRKMAICLLLTSVLGFIVSYKNHRTTIGTCVDVIFAMGLYVLLVFGKYISDFMRWIFGITIILTGISIILITRYEIKKEEDRRQKIKDYFFKLIKLIRRNTAIACTMILIVTLCILYVSKNQQIIKESTRSLEVHETYGDEYSLANNIEQIKLIRDNETFQRLNYNEKKKVVTAILRCEGRYLGVTKFDIKFKELQDKILGQYESTTKCIIINSKQLKNGNMDGGDSESILHACLHECRHHFQFLMIKYYKDATEEQRNLLVFKQIGVKDWVKNVSNYHSVHSDKIDDYYKYANQPLEADANEYASSEIAVYYRLIDNLIRKKNN